MAGDRNDEMVVRVTMRDIYDSVEKLRAEVAPVVEAVPDHETRIRVLEKWLYALPPTFVIAVAGVVTAVTKR